METEEVNKEEVEVEVDKEAEEVKEVEVEVEEDKKEDLEHIKNHNSVI